MRCVQLGTGGEAEPVSLTIERAPDGEPNAFEIAIGDRRRQVIVERPCDGSGLIRFDGRVLPFHAVVRGSSVQLWMQGRTWTLEVIEQTARRTADADAAAAKSTLAAPMPGTILSIKVQAGESFEAHEPLIIMESMKMEMTLSAPHAGRVAEVLCGEGDLVEMNALLARLEPGD